MKRRGMRVAAGVLVLGLPLLLGTLPPAEDVETGGAGVLFWEGRSIRDDATNSLPFVVGAADMTGDKVCDLVLATHYAVRIYAGDGVSGFRRVQHLEVGGREGSVDPWPSLHVSAGALVDFDRDGDLDVLLMVEEWSPTSTAYAAYAVRNDHGRLRMATRTTMDVECRQMAACTSEGAGLTYVLAVRPQWGTRWREGVALARMEADGTLVMLSERWLLEEWWTIERLADATGDGVPDAVVSHRDLGTDIVPIAPDGASLGQRHLADTGPLQAAAVADVNGDHLPDLVLSMLNGFAVLFGAGDGAFASPVLYETGYDGGPLALADYDGDGVRELLLVCDSDQQIFVFDSTSRGEFGPKIASLVPTEPISWWGEPVASRRPEYDDSSPTRSSSHATASSRSSRECRPTARLRSCSPASRFSPPGTWMATETSMYSRKARRGLRSCGATAGVRPWYPSRSENWTMPKRGRFRSGREDLRSRLHRGLERRRSRHGDALRTRWTGCCGGPGGRGRRRIPGAGGGGLRRRRRARRCRHARREPLGGVERGDRCGAHAQRQRKSPRRARRARTTRRTSSSWWSQATTLRSFPSPSPNARLRNNQPSCVRRPCQSP